MSANPPDDDALSKARGHFRDYILAEIAFSKKTASIHEAAMLEARGHVAYMENFYMEQGPWPEDG